MNPDFYKDQCLRHLGRLKWWRLYRDGVVYTFSETADNKIRIESSVGKSGVYDKGNARVFWNSLIEEGYVLGKQGLHRTERKKFSPGVVDYTTIYEELVNEMETKGDDPERDHYKAWKKEYDKEYGINSNYALEA